MLFAMVLFIVIPACRESFFKKSDMYDAIIIGAGIGGLVCGCYLAKAGMKVLIAEQHYKPGGYCTSFKRQGFTFDAAAHIFGGYKYGSLGKIFKELGVDKKVEIRKFDPSDIIITPDYKVSFWGDLDKTIENFQTAFPEESNKIKEFLYFLFSPEPNSFARIRSWTFKDLMDKYFEDDKLKAILSFPILANAGLPPSQISAFIGAKIFKEFYLDGGYYPGGNMQALPDALVEIFKESGGELRLSCLVKKIKVKDNKVTGVVLGDGEYISSKYVISNCDARQTFYKLLGRKAVGQDFLNKINSMIPSPSMFVLYLGLDTYFDTLSESGTKWFMLSYNIDKIYRSAEKGDFNNIDIYMVHVSPSNPKSLLAITIVSFKSKKYWENNKGKWIESFIKTIEKHSIPALTKHIVYKDAATPYTLYRYTLNYKGSARGWACTPSQLAVPDLRKPSFAQNLYLTGHWTTLGMGISGVVYVGYDTAKIILKKEKLGYNY